MMKLCNFLIFCPVLIGWEQDISTDQN